MNHPSSLTCGRPSRTSLALIALCLGALLAASCAHQPKRRESVNIDQRPTPAQPDTGFVGGASSTSGPTTSTSTSRPRAVPPSERTTRTALGDVVADTTAARAALSRCAGRKLLPDQEGVFDGTTSLLIDVRAKLAAGDTQRAQSLARQAKQLSASLRCR